MFLSKLSMNVISTSKVAAVQGRGIERKAAILAFQNFFLFKFYYCKHYCRRFLQTRKRQVLRMFVGRTTAVVFVMLWFMLQFYWAHLKDKNVNDGFNYLYFWLLVEFFTTNCIFIFVAFSCFIDFFFCFLFWFFIVEVKQPFSLTFAVCRFAQLAIALRSWKPTYKRNR